MARGDLNPYDLTSIKGYPDALKVYRIARSKFWQCRYFVPGRGLIRRSTRCTDQGAAIEFAKELYANILIEQRSGRLTSQASFASFAEKLMERQESMVARGVGFAHGHRGEGETQPGCCQRRSKIRPLVGAKVGHFADLISA